MTAHFATLTQRSGTQSAPALTVYAFRADDPDSLTQRIAIAESGTAHVDETKMTAVLYAADGKQYAEGSWTITDEPTAEEVLLRGLTAMVEGEHLPCSWTLTLPDSPRRRAPRWLRNIWDVPLEIIAEVVV